MEITFQLNIDLISDCFLNFAGTPNVQPVLLWWSTIAHERNTPRSDIQHNKRRFSIFSFRFHRIWKSSENQVFIGSKGSLLAASRVNTAPPKSFASSFATAVDDKVKLRKSVVCSHHISSVYWMLHLGPKTSAQASGSETLLVTSIRLLNVIYDYVQTFCRPREVMWRNKYLRVLSWPPGPVVDQ